VPESPRRDGGVTPRCRGCGAPLPTGITRTHCGPACRQRAYRARHAPDPATPPAPLPAARSRTATGIYECPGCGERLAGARRCPDCNLYARRIGTGGECPACGDTITITELLEAATT
jgi:ribosomal protein L37AE/L43A